jgi:hypothetical protein
MKSVYEWQSAQSLAGALQITKKRLVAIAKRHALGVMDPEDGDPDGVIETKAPPTFGKGASNAFTVYRVKPESRSKARPDGYWFAEWNGLVDVYDGEMSAPVATFWAIPPSGQRRCEDAQQRARTLATAFCVVMNGEGEL